MNSLKQSLLSGVAFFCVVASISLYSEKAAAQITTVNEKQQRSVLAPTLSAELSDSFSDPDNDGKAKAGDEVTYTATITNNSPEYATNVLYTNQIDSKTTLVAGSVQAHLDGTGVLRCTFETANGGSGGCLLPSGAYGVTNSGNYTTLGGQFSQLNLTAANVSYNSGTQIFQFDAALQNLIEQSLGTIDNVTLEPTGIKLFLNSGRVTSGSGSISFANPNGYLPFTTANQPYYQYSQILQQNQTSAARTLQLNVPNTVESFTLDFLVSTTVPAKLVINEIMANPANPGIANEQPLEWFEVYNAGLFPVNMQGFKVGDSAASGDQLTHTIAAPLMIEPGGYLVFGGSTNTVTNGGAPVDYSYGAALSLGNAVDAVRILSPYHIDPDPGSSGVPIEIDRAQWNQTTSALDGVARELKNPALDNSNVDNSNWTSASVVAVYGAGGRGTPKAQNSAYTPAPPELDFKFPGFHLKSANGATRDRNLKGELPQPLAGETIQVNLGTIAPGGSATVTYKVTIANPLPAGANQISTQGTVSGSNFASFQTDDPATGTAADATVTQIFLAPTAASVIIRGRVLTPTGRAVANGQVTMTEASGETRHAITNPFGYYQFVGVPAGQTVVTQVFAKRYSFLPQTVNVSGEILDLNFIAEP